MFFLIHMEIKLPTFIVFYLDFPFTLHSFAFPIGVKIKLFSFLIYYLIYYLSKDY